MEKASDIPALRLKALRDSGIAYGVRGGLARRAFEIDQVVAKDSAQLDGIYNFNQLMLAHSVVPPVLTEATSSVKISDGTAIRVSDATYTIVEQAHFASAAPNWRDYLHPGLVYATDTPDPALMPKGDQETAAWKQFVAQGWTIGVSQADQMFDQSLSRLKRDFQGMVLYRKLLVQGMVSEPFVGRADLGVTGNGQSMSVNDRILRITATPQLNTRSQSWKPLVVPSVPPSAGQGGTP
ncbi:MAG: type IV secretion system protein DotC [Burkholderiaceae bacterium]|nr:MAG: type IV secretion system protein DotC [Burkholderiaceae bacterium]